MIRYIGIFILASSLSSYGAVLSSSLKASNNLRKEILILLKSIERCIKYGNGPVTDILNKCDLPLLQKCGFCKELLNSSDTEAVIDSTLHSLSKKDRDQLSAFFSSLGKSQHAEYELKNCGYYIDYFEKTQNENETDICAKISLYKKLGLLAGILSAIIFI